MTAPAHGIEQHPDLTAMRLRYEKAAATPGAQALEGLTLLTGLYIAVSPWIVGFDTVSATVTMNNLIVGLAFTVLALGFGSAYERTHPLGWTAPLLGAWVIITPWVVAGAPAQAGTIVSNVIAGGVAALCVLAVAGLAAKGKQKS